MNAPAPRTPRTKMMSRVAVNQATTVIHRGRADMRGDLTRVRRVRSANLTYQSYPSYQSYQSYQSYPSCYFVLVAVKFPVRAPDIVPAIVLPLTRPVYFTPPASKLMSAPRSFPFEIAWLPTVPVKFWNFWLIVTVLLASDQAPSTLAGTIQRCAEHHDWQFSTFTVSSASQSSIVNVFVTMRVPGAMSRICGRRRMLMLGSRNIVTTFAFEKSLANRSACSNVASLVTPASSALRFESATMSGLYSMPSARAPRFAASMTVRPSPDPRSTTKSFGVTLAMSSIALTVSIGVGTQTTSLPACPLWGTNGFCPD